LAVYLGHPLDGPDIGRIVQKALLLLQLLDELGPPIKDRITDGLRHCGKGKGLQNWHWVSPLLDQTQLVLTSRQRL